MAHELLSDEELALRSDLLPGFWPEWQEPTPMAAAIQMPMNDPAKWMNGVINAHNKRKK